MTQAESSEKRSIRLQSLSGGNSSGREPGSPVESLEDKRKEAFFKVQAAKAAQLQRQQEIRVGEDDELLGGGQDSPPQALRQLAHGSWR